MATSSLEIKQVISFVYENSGITLDENKSYLIESRLSPLLKSNTLSSFSQLITKAKTNKPLKQDIINAISTNETYFFRDQRPFDLLKNILIPEIMGTANKRLKIWSAACSTGQEAYSIAMLLKELLFNFTTYSIQIHGTDISGEAVNKANSGIYTNFDLSRGLSPLQITRYFKAEGTNFKISDELRSLCQFREDNILKPRALPNSYHLALCRNVAIYFNKEDKLTLLEAIHKSLRPGGFLLIGSTESIPYASHLFERTMHNGAIYYKKR